MDDQHHARWVETDSQLRACIEEWSGCDALAIDTEFVRTDTFYARLGLIQVADGHRSTLIDPLALNLDPLLELLQAPSITKVLHSASEDLGIFWHLGRVQPRPLFDTQVAAGLLGLGPSLSYPALLKELLGIQIDKGEQRSDWLRRPLTAAQQHYAVNDVEHLLEVYRRLHAGLEEADRLGWALEDSEAMLHAVGANQSVAQLYQRFKLAWKLDSAGRIVLWRLLEWRERDAKRLDRPRSRILHDDAILHLAIQQPAQPAELEQVPRMSPGLRRKVGSQLLALIAAALAAPSSDRPAPTPPPLGPQSKSQMKALKGIVSQRAEQLALTPELLCSRRDLVALLRDGDLPQRLRGWRRAVVGDELLAAVA